MSISHLFFDVGGVLGTDGWSSPQRRKAVERFGLDPAEFEQQHRDTVGTFEQGRMTLEEYLDATVFYRGRDFSREAFVEFMLAESRPHEATIALARRLADTGKYRMMTLNNESLELNRYRIERFGLSEIFEAFFSSCWLGFTKPSRRIYELALASRRRCRSARSSLTIAAPIWCRPAPWACGPYTSPRASGSP